MRRAFALVLALGLLFSLAACGEPEPTGTKKPGTTTTQPDPSVNLVTAYETDNSICLGKFAMAFTYNSDCRGGTAVVRADGKEHPGTFTCDENYNINHMQFALTDDDEKSELVINCVFDDAHRLLSAKVTMKSGDQEELRYRTQHVYDSQGRNTENNVEVPGRYTTSSKREYRQDGQVLRQTITNQSHPSASAMTTVMAYEYDENGHMKSIQVFDESGELVQELPATYEVKNDGIHYTLEQGSDKIIMVVDEKGQVILQENYSNGQLTVRMTTEFDEAGRVLRTERQLLQVDTTIVITYVYTADGRLQEQKTTENGTVTTMNRTTFETVEIKN